MGYACGKHGVVVLAVVAAVGVFAGFAVSSRGATNCSFRQRQASRALFCVCACVCFECVGMGWVGGWGGARNLYVRILDVRTRENMKTRSATRYI